MNQLDKSGVVIDACSGCEGFWLDRGELERMIARRASGSPGADRLRAVLEEMTRTEPEFAEKSDLDCPRCRKKLGKITFRGAEVTVAADKCAMCGGLWLDSGEMGLLFALVEEKRRSVGAVGIALGLVALVLAAVVAVLLFRIFGHAT